MGTKSYEGQPVFYTLRKSQIFSGNIVCSNTNDTYLCEDTDQVSEFSIILDDDLTRLDKMES